MKRQSLSLLTFGRKRVTNPTKYGNLFPHSKFRVRRLNSVSDRLRWAPRGDLATQHDNTIRARNDRLWEKSVSHGSDTGSLCARFKACLMLSEEFPDRALTPDETSRLTGYKEQTLANKRTNGSGPPFLGLPRAPRYMLKSTLRWLIAHERRSTSDGSTPR